MKPITFSDLDGVYFQSRRLCPPNVDLTPVALDSKGVPSSFMTAKQSAFLDWLLSLSDVVPVTARPTESFQRLLVSFKGYAICSFGGVILTPAGVPEPTWYAQIEQQSSRCVQTLDQLRMAIARASGEDGIALDVTSINDCGCDLYLNCKILQPDLSEHHLARTLALLQRLLPGGWRLHSNGNNFAVLPPYLGKERAVSFFLSDLMPSHSFVLGVGDSLSDLDFMAMCDYAVTPANSQVFATLRTFLLSEST
jgi:hydroxymethylpyrimidine pyrophosphatase-like HAD family hydrolase